MRNEEGDGSSFTLDPNWKGLDGNVTLRYDVGKMRAIARELKTHLEGIQGKGSDDGYTTGTTSSIMDHCQLKEAQIGMWDDALKFGKTVGKESGGSKFHEAYSAWAQAVVAAIEAIEANADVYAKTNPTQGA
ncbi:hypothetical protein ACIBHX_08775 [Nonomuraea sp. NPDC050536]|uniref:hypothetical protein n=1 Tax=Nonomuraea sp. NPDC050536 TaxID=3364366 RepID=UPI0037C60E64